MIIPYISMVVYGNGNRFIFGPWSRLNNKSENHLAVPSLPSRCKIQSANIVFCCEEAVVKFRGIDPIG